jgi:hypothetical protein
MVRVQRRPLHHLRVLAIALFLGVVVLAWWLGAYTLALGVMLLIFGFKLRHVLG